KENVDFANNNKLMRMSYLVRLHWISKKLSLLDTCPSKRPYVFKKSEGKISDGVPSYSL
ncbi:hypothetical protein L9F63_012977, partial [Diploptera punctata]